MSLKIQCPKHKRYNGIKSPRASCIQCQSIYSIRLQATQDRLVTKP